MSQEMMEVLDDIRDEAMQQGRQEGIKQGKQEGEIEALIKIYKSGMIKASDAANMLKINLEDFLKLAQ